MALLYGFIPRFNLLPRSTLCLFFVYSIYFLMFKKSAPLAAEASLPVGTLVYQQTYLGFNCGKHKYPSFRHTETETNRFTMSLHDQPEHQRDC